MSFSVGTIAEYFEKKTEATKSKVLHELTFIDSDSYQLMPWSLCQLVDNLKTGVLDKFKYTNQEFNDNAELMTRTGVYPYSFMDSWDKFDVNVTELYIGDFKNDLMGDDIKKEDYEFFKFVCKHLNIKTLLETITIYIWKVMYYY